MSIRCRVRAWASLSCLGLGIACGCSSSSTPPAPAPAPAAAAPAPAISSPNTEMAPDQEQAAAASAGDGFMPTNGGGADGGMLSGDAGMAMPGMSSGMPGYDGGMAMAGPGGGGMPGVDSITGPGMMMGGPGMDGGMGMNGMGGMGGPAFVDPAPADDADYLSKAKYAFAIGKETAAEQYVIAEMLANEAEAANLLTQIRFSTSLRKPALTLRFGVGVNLESPTSITDYKPIGRSGVAGANGQGGGGGEMGMMGGGMPGGAQAGGAQKNFGDLTGRFGEELIKSFEAAWDSGTFGSIFADVETIVPVNRLNQTGQNNRGMDMGGMPGMGGGMGLNSFGGEGMPGGAGGAPAAAADEALRLRATAGKAIVPGLTFLGTGKETELLGKAETEGLDYIFMFEVKVEMKRRGQQMVSNDTKLRLLSVKETAKDKRTLGSTNTLNNIKVDVAMAEKGDNDDVAKNLGNLFRKVEALKLQDMPKMKPESAQARIKSLIEKKTKDVLPILMEIKLFHSQGLLNDEERDAAYQLTLPNGLAFVNGSPEDRAFVLDPLLPGYK